MIDAAILGLGSWGRQIVDAVQGRSERIRFAAAVVPRPALHADYAAGKGVALGSDYAAILADPAIEAVVITSPNTLHADQAIRAAEAGKHVFCEKPFASSLDEARRVLAATDAAGVACAVGFQRRFLKPYREMARRIAAGAIGTPCHIECNQSADAAFRFGAESWRARPEEFRGGGMAGHGIHMIDAVIGLFGPFAEVAATARRRVPGIHIDDTTFLTFTLAGGVTGYLGTMMASAAEHRLQVFGTGGWIEMRDHRLLAVQPLHGPRETVDFGPSPLILDALECFAGVVAGTQGWPVTREQVLAGQAAFDAIAESVECGRPVAVAA